VNEEEIAALLRMVKALCPAQRFDEFTPDAWLLVLDEVSFADARDALKPLALAQPFIAPTDIAKHVRRVRNERIGRLPQPVPNEVPGVNEREELLAVRRAIADGRINSIADLHAYEQWGGSLHLAYERGETPALTAGPHAQPLRQRPVTQAIAGTFQRVPGGDER
jgi:hypothetical protein